MAEKVTIARPYAKAAFDYARAHNAFARWSDFLSTSAAIVADPRVARLLSDPRVVGADLISLIASSDAAALDEHGKNFISTLAHNQRLGLLPEIAAMFEKLRADAENVADVHVSSAIPLDDAQRKRLAVALKKRLQREVRLHCIVDPTLVGGAIVRSGDLVIDGSLRSRLDRLATEMTH